MRKIAATYILDTRQGLIKNGILVCENDGTIQEIIRSGLDFKEQASLEYYSGVLVPGFVNAHCHLELSHLNNIVEEKSGIGAFLGSISRLRKKNDTEINKAAQLADRKMWAAGIAAVGDVSNTSLTVSVKMKSLIRYHTFVETFGFLPSRAERALELAAKVKKEHEKNGLKASIVPHAAYSVSESLFKKIRSESTASSILSIHNQESQVEAQFFQECVGPIMDHYKNNLGLDVSHWHPTGKNSLQNILKHIPSENQLLLVHNTFTSKADIETLLSKRNSENTYMVICPNSNLYIENTLPPLALFQKYNLNICLGTDSLASNHQLSILEEMKTIQKFFPETELSDLIKWASLKGAQALVFSDQYGSFEPGKKPGVNLLTGLDMKQMKLTENTRVKRLL